MALRLIDGPDAEPLSLAQVRLHLRIDASGAPASHPDDELLTRYIAAARRHLDGRDGWLGRVFITQTWDLLLDRFPAAEIRVPLPPLQSVSSVQYMDTAGDTQTLSTDDYTVDAVSEPGWIVPGTAGWPSTYDQINAVAVRFVAGYGTTGADVPETIVQAMLLLIGHWYQNREAVARDGLAPLPMAVESLLAPLRVWSFG